jgi:hypothetical protein
LSDAILDGGLSYEMADDGGSAIWMAIDHINHHRFLDAWSRQNHISTTIEAVAMSVVEQAIGEARPGPAVERHSVRGHPSWLANR